MTPAPPYSKPVLLFNRHLETIYPSIFRKPKAPFAQRERLITPDDDFLDLDWYRQDSERLIIISHGLEGNSTRGYVIGMSIAFLQSGYDVLAWNYRGCSGELNWKARFYHSGATDDLDTIVDTVHKTKTYKSIGLVGFSLGGNLTLKYLGEGYSSGQLVRGAVAISVPLDLGSSSEVLGRAENWIYTKRFLISLKKKVKEKASIMKLPIEFNLNRISTLREFDNCVTAPLHGFKDADDYYTQNSALPFLPRINCPTLIINALNDPFLSDRCYPDHVDNRLVRMIYPRHGGHVGFTLFNQNGLYWSEMQALKFMSSPLTDV